MFTAVFPASTVAKRLNACICTSSRFHGGSLRNDDANTTSCTVELGLDYQPEKLSVKLNTAIERFFYGGSLLRQPPFCHPLVSIFQILTFHVQVGFAGAS